MKTEDIKKKNSHFFQNENLKLDGGEGACTVEIPTFDDRHYYAPLVYPHFMLLHQMFSIASILSS